MTDNHERDGEIQVLRERLSRLSNASLRINDSLDYDSVLRGVLESARSLTGALFGIIVLFDDDLQIEDSLISGLSPEHTAGLLEMPHGIRFFERTGGIAEPVRHPDFHAYVRGLGLAEFALPMPVSSPLPFLFAPIRYRERPVGTIYLGDRAGGEEFTNEDEEALVMFASQAALVLANARYHQDEQRARGDLEALVNTAPVGVLVFNARSGVLVSFNRETRRIGAVLTAPRDVSPRRSSWDAHHPPGRRPRVLAAGAAPGHGPAGRRNRARRGDRALRARRPESRCTAQRHSDPLGRRRSGVLRRHHPGLDPPRGDGAAAGRVPRHGEPRVAQSPDLHQGLGEHPARRGVPPGPRRDAAVPPHHLRTVRAHAQPDRRPARRGPH